MRQFLNHTLLILSFVCCCELVAAQVYMVETFSVQDGLAQSQVYASIQDHNGYLWFGTRGGGLSRYDGKSFKTFSERQGLAGNYVNSIFEDHKLRLWVSSDDGISIWQNEGFSQVHIDSLILPIVRCFHEVEDEIWLGTSEGIYKIQESDSGFVMQGKLLEGTDVQVMRQQGRQIWIGTDQGIYLLEKGDFKNYRRKEGLNSLLINDIEFDTSGRLWVSMNGGGVQVLEKGRFENPDFEMPRVVFDLCIEGQEIWMGSLDEGVIIYNLDRKELKRIDKKHGLRTDQIRTILRDSWGNIWFGTSGGGVSKYAGQRFAVVNRLNGLPSDQVYAVRQGYDGRIWLSVGEKGIVRYDVNTGTVALDSVIPNVKCKSIYLDFLDRMWVGTEGEGIYVYSKDTTFHIDGDSGLSSPWVKDVKQKSDSSYVVATTGGGIVILTAKDSAQTIFEDRVLMRSIGLAEDRISCLEIDTLDRIWYGTHAGGVGVVFPDGYMVNFSRTDGLLSNVIRSLKLDDFGRLWIATANGINVIDLTAERLMISNLDDLEMLTSDNTYQIGFMGKDRCWVGSEQGVDLVRLGVDRLPEEVVHYGKAEGFVGVETCAGAIERDSNGVFWFGTVNGLMGYDAGRNDLNEVPPRVFIQDFSINYIPIGQTVYQDRFNLWRDGQDTIELQWDEHDVGFDFGSIDLRNADLVTYQWWLQGGSMNDWTPPSDRSNVTFSNLSSGDYTLLYRACNEDGICSVEPGRLFFTIATPWWELRWVQWLSGIFGLFIITLIFYFRTQRIKKRAMQRSERLKLERDLLELEQKTLRLQMNPHFIFNSLNSIQGMISKDDKKEARLQLSKFSKLMREVLENSREELVTLEDELSTLKHFLELEQVTHEHKFDYKFSVEIDAEDYFVPPLITQPFAENAIIHGVLPSGRKGMISVRCYEDGEEHLIIEIQDDGIGRKEASESRAQRGDLHKSQGLSVTQERIDRLQGGNGRKGLEIIDLLEDGHPCGTLVRIVIPVRLED